MNYGSATPSSTTNQGTFVTDAGLRFASVLGSNEQIFESVIPTGLSTSFTLHMKYKLISKTSAYDEDYPIIFEATTSGSRSPGILFWNNDATSPNNEQFYGRLYNNSGGYHTHADRFDSEYGVWYHLFVVIDKSTSSFKFYHMTGVHKEVFVNGVFHLVGAPSMA